MGAVSIGARPGSCHAGRFATMLPNPPPPDPGATILDRTFKVTDTADPCRCKMLLAAGRRWRRQPSISPSRRSLRAAATPAQATPTTDTAWAPQLPPLTECSHHVNLTNGVELIPVLDELGLQFSRIQSTACEQQRFEALVAGLDPELLMALAAGRTCLVWDCAIRAQGRHGASRAIWYGLEFVRFALALIWYERRTEAFLRGCRVTKEFEARVGGFSKGTVKKLRYYAKYAAADSSAPDGPRVPLYGVTRVTAHDGEVDFYRRTLQQHARSDYRFPTVRALEGDPRQILAAYGLQIHHAGDNLHVPSDKSDISQPAAPAA